MQIQNAVVSKIESPVARHCCDMSFSLQCRDNAQFILRGNPGMDLYVLRFTLDIISVGYSLRMAISV